MNKQVLQGILSIVAIICIVIGFAKPFSPEINDLIYRKIFYIIIGVSFILMAPSLANQKFAYPMYVAAALCIIGAFLPVDSKFEAIKAIGLFAGVIISIFNRQKVQRR